MIVTQDSDFLRKASSDPMHHGIVFYPQGERSFGEVIRYLALIHDVMDADEMLGRIEYL